MNRPTAAELVALVRSHYIVFTHDARYRLRGDECTLTSEGVYVPERLRHLDIQSVWVELPNDSLVCLRGMRGRYLCAGAVHQATA